MSKEGLKLLNNIEFIKVKQIVSNLEGIMLT
jgi:hypothetical protein